MASFLEIVLKIRLVCVRVQVRIDAWVYVDWLSDDDAFLLILNIDRLKVWIVFCLDFDVILLFWLVKVKYLSGHLVDRGSDWVILGFESRKHLIVLGIVSKHIIV